MRNKLASPLFIVRNQAEKDLFAVLEKLSEIGFDGVEFLGFFGKKPAEIRKKMDSLSLKAVGNHVGADEFLKDPNKVIADHLELGCKYITIAWPGGSPHLPCAEFDQTIGEIQNLAQACVGSGITPLYHNHAFEFEPFSLATMLDTIMDNCLQDGLRLEPDLGWMATKQIDPQLYLQKYKEFCPVIHLKDVYCDQPDQFEFRPTGYGTLNYPLLLLACLQCNPDWFVIDHDLAYERDSFDDLQLSLEYVKNLLTIMKVS